MRISAGRSAAPSARSERGAALVEFALVVPVPTVIGKSNIKVLDNALIDHVDAYTAPRLVEYHDPDPCRPLDEYRLRAAGAPGASTPSSSPKWPAAQRAPCTNSLR
mgnify:CR=1 FL=1